MLFKLKQISFLILCLLILNSCHTRKAASTFIKQKPNKEQQKKDKEKAKKKAEYLKGREKARKNHYDKQAESTKNNWDLNDKKSKKWIKTQYHDKSLGYRIRKFFERFKREPKPDDGLFTKKQKNSRKKNIFQRIFKKDKKKKGK